ncbi:MAG: helix-turn-helix domain-containing protein [Candidatus Krumholzibacteria bacterium]|nr:helix-turn-helix domain-containing protein [Candidatus Krumholzibacteria bacterium]
MTRESLLTEFQAAEILRISVFSLRRWRSERRGQGPAWVRLGRAIRYEPSELERYVSACRCTPDAGGGR